MIQIWSSISPRRATSAMIASTDPPGSITAAFIVCVHQTVVQFCCSGVTGVTNTPTGDRAGEGDWLIGPT